MKKYILLIVVILITGLSAFAKAKSKLEFTDAKVFAPMKGSNATAAYVRIQNKSKAQVSLVVSKAEDFSAAELHETFEANGRMGMRKVEKLLIDAGRGFDLKPGGNHIMLFDAKHELQIGATLPIEFLINGKSKKVEFKIISRNQN
jgi:copper(I)-binding protein